MKFAVAVVAVCAVLSGGCAELLGLEEGIPFGAGAGGSGGEGCPSPIMPATCEAPNLEASDNCLGGGCMDGRCQPRPLASSMYTNDPIGITVADGYVIWGSGNKVVIRSPDGSFATIENEDWVARVAKQGDYVFSGRSSVGPR